MPSTWLEDINMLELSTVRRAANRKRKLMQKALKTNESEDVMPIPEKVLNEFFAKAAMTDDQMKAIKAALGELGKAKEGMDEEAFGRMKMSIAKLLGFGATQKSLDEAKAELETEKTSNQKVVEVCKSVVEKLQAEKPSINEAITALAEVAQVTPVLKSLDSLPPEIRAEWEAMQKSREADRKELEEMRKSLEEKEARATEREFIAKAEKLPYVPMGSSDLGKLMHAISKSADKEVAEAFGAMLDKVNEMAKESEILKELGGGGDLPTDPTGVVGKIDALAQQMIQKSDKQMTKEQAFALVLEQNPKLYDEYNRQGQ